MQVFGMGAWDPLGLRAVVSISGVKGRACLVVGGRAVATDASHDQLQLCSAALRCLMLRGKGCAACPRINHVHACSPLAEPPKQLQRGKNRASRTSIICLGLRPH